jgi:hypothetical protein
MAIDLEFDADDRDQAETFDETHITEDGEDIARPDMMRNVYDVTSAEGDGDDDDLSEEDAEDFDPDTLDESELESLLEADDGVDDEEGPITRDDADIVADEDVSPVAMQAESGVGRVTWSLGVEERRDRVLEDSFPASDSPPTTPGAN